MALGKGLYRYDRRRICILVVDLKFVEIQIFFLVSVEFVGLLRFAEIVPMRGRVFRLGSLFRLVPGIKDDDF